MNNKNENERYEQNIDNTVEKKGIICLIIIALILIYFALFFIHDIVDWGTRTANGTGYINPTIKPTTNTINNNIGNNTIKNQTVIGDQNIIEDNTITPDQNTIIPTPTPTPKPQPVDYSDRIRVVERTGKNAGKEFSELVELDIFENGNYNHAAKLAPGVSGTYNFTVENETRDDYTYTTSFAEENPYAVPMEYRIKRNGEYILGDDSTWIKNEDVITTVLSLPSSTIDLYTIEWRWPYEGDDVHDTQIGMTDGAYYKMTVRVDAEQI